MARGKPSSLKLDISKRAALAMIKPLRAAAFRKKWGLGGRRSGVRTYDIGSYGIVRYLEKPGDKLTGDHQPSGAAVKEALRLRLHALTPGMLTRSMAANAYERAVTMVMPERWHRKCSRTYGGRNTKAQISSDAADLGAASEKDWAPTAKEMQSSGLTKQQIQKYRQEFVARQKAFFLTGEPQWHR